MPLTGKADCWLHGQSRQRASTVTDKWYIDVHALEHRHEQVAHRSLSAIAKVTSGFERATTATGKNMDEVLSEDYVSHFIDKGAMYLW